MKSLRFIDYMENQDTLGPDPVDPGTMQRDPDASSQADDLIASLKEIIELAQKAIHAKKQGLGDLSANKKPNEDSEDDPTRDAVQRPKADSASSMFGME